MYRDDDEIHHHGVMIHPVRESSNFAPSNLSQHLKNALRCAYFWKRASLTFSNAHDEYTGVRGEVWQGISKERCRIVFRPIPLLVLSYPPMRA
jgi:hypothetical protein